MRKILLLMMLVLSLGAKAQCTFHNTAFNSGEFLSYNLYFNWKFVWVKAGTASMYTVQSHYNGRPAYRGSLITRGSERADKFFLMRDTLLSYSTLDMAPLYYRKGAREGERYTVDEAFYSYPNGNCRVKLHRQKKDGSQHWKTHNPGHCVFDMMNIFLRARSFNPTSWKKGQVVSFHITDGLSINSAKIVYNGKNTIKADNGHKYRCLQLSYYETEDGKTKEIARFYVSDDQNHIPVRIDMYLKFGAAKAFLVGMKGVRGAVTSRVK